MKLVLKGWLAKAHNEHRQGWLKTIVLLLKCTLLLANLTAVALVTLFVRCGVAFNGSDCAITVVLDNNTDVRNSVNIIAWEVKEYEVSNFRGGSLSFLPLLLLKQFSSVAKTFNIFPNSLEYGFDPEMIYANERPFFKKKKSMLKDIESEFSDASEEGSEDPYAL